MGTFTFFRAAAKKKHTSGDLSLVGALDQEPQDGTLTPLGEMHDAVQQASDLRRPNLLVLSRA